MAIDFGKLVKGPTADTATHPKDIFSLLPVKATRYQYLRDVQSEVLNQWHNRRTEPSITIKMNTGGGKTVVGLLLLKACLNEGISPAIYVAPTPYLVNQVISEARDLGIAVTENVQSPRFLKGKEILVGNIFKLVNGQSVFGVAREGPKIDIGSIVIDDAHACASTTEDQFTLTIEARPGENYFGELLNLFKDDLHAQSAFGFSELLQMNPNREMLVPFWAWQKKTSEVLKILSGIQNNPEMTFKFPLIAEQLRLCNCVFGNGKCEISSRCLPINVIPSLAAAKRRIFMTATLSDESVLLTHFDIPSSDVSTVICPTSANDIGDRLILTPQEISPDLTDEMLRAFAHGVSKKYNVVVLVPSDFRTAFWKDVATEIVNAKNIDKTVEQLKSGHVGLVVFVNKYDGVDLPNNACRVLIIDGLPDVRKLIDKIEQSILRGSDEIVARSIQKIEQGMGRGIRSNEDFCAILLMGRSLVRQLYARNANQMFSPATKAQLVLSENLAEQIRDKGVKGIEEVLGLFLSRDKDWVTASLSALLTITYETTPRINTISAAQRAAFNAASIGNFQDATKIIQQALNQSAGNPIVQGWLKWQLAEYLNFIDGVQAQTTLQSGLALNNQLLRPLAGIAYVRINPQMAEQAAECLNFLRTTYKDPNKLLVELNGVLDNLMFQPDTATSFEQSIAEIAYFLGFRSQRPEADYGRGPDDLWLLGKLQFLVIECKNGTTTPKINKHDCNQLAGSINWFKQEYDATCTATPVMIHCSNVFEYAASAPPNTRIITPEKLDHFKNAIRQFCQSVCSEFATIEVNRVAALLAQFKLTGDGVITEYSTEFK
jgi:hypothetical protein